MLLVAGGAFLLLALLVWAGPAMKPEHTALLLFLGLLTLRPATFGEVYGPVGGALILAVAVLVLRMRVTKEPLPAGGQLVALGVVTIFPLATTSTFNESTLSGVVMNFVVAFTALAVARHERITRRLVDLFVLLAAQQSVCAVIAHQLGMATAFTLVPPAGANRAGWAYRVSPLGSVTTGSGGVLPELGPRLTGPYGEPGLMAAMMAIAAGLDLWVHGRIRWRAHAAYIAAIVLTQSIAGMAAYAIAIGVFFWLQFTRSRRVRVRHYCLIALVLIGCLRAATTEDNALVQVKNEANEISVSDRLGGASPQQLLDAWIDHPLGTKQAGVSAGINLVKASMSYGPLMLLAGLWLYLGHLRGPRWRQVAPATAALLLTVVFAQPPLLYSWIFVAFLLGGGAMPERPDTSLTHDRSTRFDPRLRADEPEVREIVKERLHPLR